MNIEQTVDALWHSIQQGVHDPEELRGKLSIDDAYRVQLGLLDKYMDAGEELVGWKVGLTAKSIQEQVGFHEPVFGFLLRSGHRQSGADFDFASLVRPGFESELCLTMQETISGPAVTTEQARDAISVVAPALEITETRCAPPMDMALILADNAQQKAFVTGTAVPLGDLELAEVTVEVVVNGIRQERARGAEVLGTPVASIQWLANKLAYFGRKLEAGSHVMSGSFTKQYPISSGDVVESKFEPVGLASAQFH